MIGIQWTLLKCAACNVPPIVHIKTQVSIYISMLSHYAESVSHGTQGLRGNQKYIEVDCPSHE